MQILGLRTTIYRVSDIEKAKQWYTDLLGFAPYFDEPFYAGFNVGGFELGLQPEEGAVKTKSEGVNTYWGVEYINATFKNSFPWEQPNTKSLRTWAEI